MAKESKSAVTMRVRVGDSELEVSGPKEFVEEKIDEFLKKSRQAIVSAHQPKQL
jgi:predicted metal-dependent hydrolase